MKPQSLKSTGKVLRKSTINQKASIFADKRTKRQKTRERRKNSSLSDEEEYEKRYIQRAELERKIRW